MQNMMPILYSNNCPKCSVLKKKLYEAGIEYEEENDVNKMLAMGLSDMPVLGVDGKMMDFSQAVRWIGEVK